MSRYTETDLANMLILELTRAAQGISPVSAQGSLYAYSGGVWLKVLPETVYKKLLSWHNQPFGTNTIKITNQLLKNTYKVIQHGVRDDKFFDQAPAGLTFKNGFYSVDGELKELKSTNRSKFYVTQRYERDQQPNLFLKFLNEVFEGDSDAPQKIQAIREFIGASLFGIAYNFEACLVLIGNGRNGKSVLLDIISGLFEYGLTSVTPHDMANLFLLAQLHDAKINVHHELPAKSVTDSTQFKAVISGQSVLAQHKFGDPFTFKPTCGHVFGCNDLPETSDSSFAFWRRFLVARFNRKFDGSVQTENIVTPILNERESILCWVADAVPDLWKRKAYTEIPSATEELNYWKVNNDSALAFIEANIEKDNNHETGATTLHTAYQRYCQQQGLKALNRQKFSKALRTSGIDYKRKAQGIVYYCRITNPALEYVTNLLS